MALGFIAALSISLKIIIAMHPFKRVVGDMGFSPLRNKVSQMLQLIPSMLITLPFILKTMNVVLLPYLSLNDFWKLLYSYTTWSVKVIHIWILDIKFNWFRGANTENNMTNYLISYILKKRKKYIMSRWDYQFIFSPHNPITHEYAIYFMEIIIKTCTICGFLIYTYL